MKRNTSGWMTKLACAGSAAALLAWAGPAAALAAPLEQSAPAALCAANGPDVVLDIPNLSVEQLTLEVDNLQARLDLDARVSTLVTLKAGVDVSTDHIKLDIKGVAAEVHLKICLDNVRAIVERTLTSLDKNPQLLTGLLSAVSGLLTQTVNQLGQTVLRVVDATGNIVERTLDASGNVIGQNVIGNVTSLPVLSQTTNSLGQTVKRVTDPSGAVIEVVQDSAGKILSTRVVS